MSLHLDRSTEARLEREIQTLQMKQAAEMKKVAVATKNQNSAINSAARSTSQASAKSHISKADREARNLERAHEQAARFGSEITRKMDELSRVRKRIFAGEEKQRKEQLKLAEKHRTAEAKARKELQDDNSKLAKDLQNLKEQLTAAMETQASDTQPFVVENADGQATPYDFFISHASADKEDFVSELVRQAEKANLNVWFDEDAIEWGQSIRQKIDEGLRRSYFGVVVLSPNFFSRPWTEYELDAIIQRDLSGRGRILPIWHRHSQDDVQKHAPSLAGRLALPTSNYSTEQIVAELLRMRDRFKNAAVDSNEG